MDICIESILYVSSFYTSYKIHRNHLAINSLEKGGITKAQCYNSRSQRSYDDTKHSTNLLNFKHLLLYCHLTVWPYPSAVTRLLTLPPTSFYQAGCFEQFG